MLKLLFKNNKSLVVSKPCRIYQRESNADLIYLYIPTTYDGFDLSKFSVSLEYVNSANISYLELLTAIDSDKENYLLFTLPSDSKFTYLAGDVKMKISMSYYDESDERTYVIKSSELVITILPINDYFVYTDNDTLTAIDNKILELQTATDKLAAMAESIPASIAVDLEINEQTLQLVNDEGSLIGDGVQITTSISDPDSVNDGMVDLTDVSDDTPVTNPSARAVDLLLTDNTLQLVSDTGKIMGDGVKITTSTTDTDGEDDGILDV